MRGRSAIDPSYPCIDSPSFPDSLGHEVTETLAIELPETDVEASPLTRSEFRARWSKFFQQSFAEQVRGARINVRGDQRQGPHGAEASGMQEGNDESDGCIVDPGAMGSEELVRGGGLLMVSHRVGLPGRPTSARLPPRWSYMETASPKLEMPMRIQGLR